MPAVDHINYTWSLDRYQDVHYLLAGYSSANGKGTLYLKLTPYPPRLGPNILRMWEVKDAAAKVDALAGFLGTVMAELNGGKP
jgi:hypothetical protein